MTARVWLEQAKTVSTGPIGMHVRRGDMSHILSLSPSRWFIDTLERIRQSAGFAAEAFVVSDARPEELRELLRVPKVRYVFTGSSIGDLLVLSRSRVLLASGGSTFSAWAAFLGQMPAASAPGYPLNYFGSVYTKNRVTEFHPDRPDALFLQAARAALSS